jgi:hypothetical protein
MEEMRYQPRLALCFAVLALVALPSTTLIAADNDRDQKSKGIPQLRGMPEAAVGENGQGGGGGGGNLGAALGRVSTKGDHDQEIMSGGAGGADGIPGNRDKDKIEEAKSTFGGDGNSNIKSKGALSSIFSTAGSERGTAGWSGGSGRIGAVPGPVAGAGLPIIAIGYYAYWLIRRRRKSRTPST